MNHITRQSPLISKERQTVYALFIDILKKVRIIGLLLAKKGLHELTQVQANDLKKIKNDFISTEADCLLTKAHNEVKNKLNVYVNALMNVFAEIYTTRCKLYPNSAFAKEKLKEDTDKYLAVLSLLCNDYEGIKEVLPSSDLDVAILTQANLLSEGVMMGSMTNVFGDRFDLRLEKNSKQCAYYRKLKSQADKRLQKYFNEVD